MRENASLDGRNFPPDFGVCTAVMYARGLATAAWLCLAGIAATESDPMYVRPEVQERRVLHRVRPAYPKLAIQARIEGTVKLLARIDSDGAMEQLRLIDGHPLLVPAAIDAAKQWRYLPAFRNGVAVPVITVITITFRMSRFNLPSEGPIVPVRLRRVITCTHAAA